MRIKNNQLRSFSSKSVYIAIFFLLIYAFFLWFLFPVQATLTSVKDTLSNSRFSFLGNVGIGVSTPGTSITIGTGGTFTDVDLKNLFQRDTVCFTHSGFNECLGNTTYTVATVPSQSGTLFQLATSVPVNIGTTDVIVASQSATHTVTFTTANTVNGPVFEVQIPAGSQLAAANNPTSSINGMPDYGASAVAGTNGFDLAGVVAGDVTCSNGTASVVSANSGSKNYHSIRCSVSVGTTVPNSTAITITIGGTHKFVNPAPITSGHTRGISDPYSVVVNEWSSVGVGDTAPVDASTISIAPVEGVLVSATVQNTLSFSIAAVAASTSVCGKTTSVATTATTVPFGTITSGAFYNAAHLLTVSTNAASGYVVTAQENAALSIDGLGTTTLADTACPPGSCTTTTSADWTTNTTSGFGYSLANSSGTDASFLYNESSRTFSAKPYDSSTARTIMTNASPVSGSAANVCYQIATSGTQKAGYYLNKLTYIATPTF